MIRSNRLRGVLLSIGAFALLSGPSTTMAQRQRIEDRLSDPVYMAWVSEPAVATCIECHFEGPGLASIASGRSSELTEFSRREEMDAWINLDKHTIARRRVEPRTPKQQEAELLELIGRLDKRADEIVAVFDKRGVTLNRDQIGLNKVPEECVGASNILSRRICDKLWGPDHVDSPEGYAEFREACLTCHGGVKPGAEPVRPESVLTDAPIGIDCLYCHNVGGEKSWETEHYNKDHDQWRLASPSAKAARGMRDLANTNNQAALCFDCHIGNRDKGMFITHRMYAAGHPPLPSIELQTFCDQMPQHWQSPGQLYENLKGYDKRNEFFRTNYPGVFREDNISQQQLAWNTRKILLGALSARRHAVQLNVNCIDSKQWADYALFDCSACHHELKQNSRRQDRYQTSTVFQNPGRPRQHEWHRPLLQIAYKLAGREQFDLVSGQEAELAKCFDDTPFGKSLSVRAASERLLASIDELIAIAQRRPMEASLAKAVLKALSQTPPDQLLPYDAARQVAWSAQVIGRELKSLNPETTSLDVDELLSVESTGLDLKLPAGRQQYIYPEVLGIDLQRRESFTPDELIRRLRSMAASF